MATLTYGPFGLQFVRNFKAASPTYQAGLYYIKKSYATAIGLGDLVATGTSGNLGYVTAYTAGGTRVLGVFAGLAPYFDSSQQTTIFKQGYAGTESPTGDIPCYIIDDPDAVFRIQINGGPLTIGDRGKNADITTAGVNSSTNVSGMALDYSTVNTTSTLPLRIIGWSQNAAAGYNPTLGYPPVQPTNGFAEVILNTAERGQTTGV